VARARPALAALAQTREQAPLAGRHLARPRAVRRGPSAGRRPLGTEASLKPRCQPRCAFWRALPPERAALVVAGDLSEAELRAGRAAVRRLEAAGEAAPAAPLPPARPVAARTVLVDKPGAPQTALAVVAPGPAAGAPDAAAIKVMNAALGGLFTSRINTQLREVKGYTYGIFSGYGMGRERSQFGIRGSVRTDVTGAALADMWKEIDGMRAKPMGAAELQRVRNAQLLSLPGLFDTNVAVVAGYAGNWNGGPAAGRHHRAAGRCAAVRPRP
jgi:zinc protease